MTPDIIALAFVVVAVLLLIRNELVYRYRIRAIDSLPIGSDQFWTKYSYYESRGTYRQQLFDLTRWTYKQFYPAL